MDLSLERQLFSLLDLCFLPCEMGQPQFLSHRAFGRTQQGAGGGKDSLCSEGTLLCVLPGSPLPSWSPTPSVTFSRPDSTHLHRIPFLPPAYEGLSLPKLPVYLHIKEYFPKSSPYRRHHFGAGGPMGNSTAPAPGREMAQAGGWREKGREMTLCL